MEKLVLFSFVVITGWVYTWSPAPADPPSFTGVTVSLTPMSPAILIVSLTLRAPLVVTSDQTPSG